MGGKDNLRGRLAAREHRMEHEMQHGPCMRDSSEIPNQAKDIVLGDTEIYSQVRSLENGQQQPPLTLY